MSRVGTEVSSSLFWHPFEGSVDKEPLFVQYNKYQAQSANTSDISWYIESPANGVLLDNEVWIRWTVKINDATGAEFATGLRAAYSNVTTTVAAKALATNAYKRSAFRFGCTLQKACQNISLDINGTVMTYEFSKYHDAFNRLFITEEESNTIFPCCGGGFDNGSHQGLFDGFFPVGVASTGAQQTLVTTEFLTGYKEQVGTNGAFPAVASPYAGMNNNLINQGFTKRANYLEYLFRAGGSVSDVPVKTQYDDDTLDLTGGAGASKRYVAPLTLVIYEKLAISPFHLYDNRDIKMSIPNIRTFQLTMQLHSNYPALMFRSCASIPVFSLDWFDEVSKPQLLMRWYTPPPGYQIPKQITIPCTKVLTYTSSEFPNVVKGAAVQIPGNPTQTTFSRSNISLPAIPDLFLIYIKRRLSNYTMIMPDDYNLSIYSLQMDLEGNSGKLISAEPIHLWNMYKRHLRLYPCSRDSFDSWYKYHCVLPITASDLGVIKGAGMDNPIQLTISNLVAYDYHNVPSYNSYDGDGIFNSDVFADITAAFDFHIVCIYDKYALTLTSDGSSALQLLRVNTMGTSTLPPSGGGAPSSLADIAV